MFWPAACCLCCHLFSLWSWCRSCCVPRHHVLRTSQCMHRSTFFSSVPLPSALSSGAHNTRAWVWSSFIPITFRSSVAPCTYKKGDYRWCSLSFFPFSEKKNKAQQVPIRMRESKITSKDYMLYRKKTKFKSWSCYQLLDDWKRYFAFL